MTKKIQELPSATLPYSGSDLIHGKQGVTDVKMSIDQLRGEVASVENFYTAGGTNNTITLTATGKTIAPSEYFDGLTIEFIATLTNTGPTTINVNSLGARNVLIAGGLMPADIIKAGKRVKVVYSSTATAFEILVCESLMPYEDTGQISLQHGLNTNKLGVNTLTTPHNAVGGGIVAVEGEPASISAGPHIQYTTTFDDYPVYSHYNFIHGDISLNFDAYSDGTNYRSSHSSSNAQISKNGNYLSFNYSSAVAPADIISWNSAFKVHLVSGELEFHTPSVFYSDFTIQTTSPLLTLKDSSAIGNSATASFKYLGSDSNLLGSIGYDSPSNGILKIYNNLPNENIDITAAGGDINLNTAGDVLHSGNVVLDVGTVTPGFSATNDTQSINSSATWNIVQVNIENYDSTSDFNTTTYKWTPSLPGKYVVTASTRCIYGGIPSTRFYRGVSIHKNGTIVSPAGVVSSEAGFSDTSTCSTTIYVEMNGTTDYLEMKFTQDSGVDVDLYDVSFAGHWLSA